MTSTTILDHLKKKQILELLQKGERVDGRQFDETRSINIETGVVTKAEGSAKVTLGDTVVLAGIKIHPDRPFPDRGDQGIFICTAEILPIAHPSAEPGPPNENVIELARVVDRGIRETQMIDLSKLVLKENKSVIGMFADNSVINSDGNLFDACSYASVAALLSCMVPKYEIQDDEPVLVEGEKSKPPINTIPVSVTMARIGDHIIVDPNGEEWACMDSRITIITNSSGNICALQKGGNSGFTFDQLIKCSEIAISTGAKIRKELEKVI